MFLDHLFRRLTTPRGVTMSAPPRPAAAAAASPARPAFVHAPKYPPVDPGLPACDVQAVVESQAELIARLRRVVGGDDKAFEQRYLRPIRNLARYVHLLPASAHDHHAGPGGLFRLCLEISFYAAQAADGRIFTPTTDVETRHALEPRYKYATFLAGLFCEIYRPLALAVVTTEAGEAWPKFMLPLDDWLAQQGLQRYYVNWQAAARAAVSGAEGAAVIGSILPREESTWLDHGSTSILRNVYAVALGQAREDDSILANVVLGIRSQVLKQDELTRRDRYGHLRCGHQLELHWIDAMRERIAKQQWKVHNGMDGPVWYGTDGLYLAWPECAATITQDLDARQLKGLPRNAVTIAETLGQAGMLVAQDSGQWVWTIIVSGPDAPGDPECRAALRIREPGTLLGYLDVKPKERPFAAYLVQRTGRPDTVPPPDGVAASYSLTETPIVAPATAESAAAATIQAATPAGGQAQAQGPVAALEPASDSTASSRPKSAGRGAPGDGLAKQSGSHGAPLKAPIGAPPGQAMPTPKPSPASLVPEAVRKSLKDSDAEMVGRWISHFKAHRVEAVVKLDGGAIAISMDTLQEDDLEISAVVADVEKRGWLGSIPGQARGMKAGPIQFGDKQKIGFVISAGAAQALGFHGKE
jgi:conjugal transfer pilus assembly protein TraI